MAVLKKFHKVCVGCNHGDYTPPSFLEFLTQIFIFFMVVEIQLIMWVHWLFNAPVCKGSLGCPTLALYVHS